MTLTIISISVDAVVKHTLPQVPPKDRYNIKWCADHYASYWFSARNPASTVLSGLL